MLMLSKKVSLLSAILLGITLVVETRAVAEVSQPSAIKLTDSTAQSVPSSGERYGCLSGYGDRTYRGDRPLTRYEFAAAVDACLNQVERLINNSSNSRGDRATKEDLAVTQRQLETLRSELERLRMRVDGLETEKK